MLALPPVDIEALLVDFVSDAVAYLRSKHHRAAAHIVVHHVLKGRFQRLLMDAVKENFLICGHLNAHISPYKVDETSSLNSVVLFPLPPACDVVHLYLEKEDLV